MRFRRFSFAVLSVVLVASAASSQESPSFKPTGEMTSPRRNHTATLLPDGTVLIAGGSGQSDEALRSAELYDPATGTFIPNGHMTVPRWLHSATLLPDGTVLIAGGPGLTSAELYDPATRMFTPTGDLLEDQASHSATLLPNGTVLIAGGQPTARPEIYDVRTGKFVFAGNYAGVGPYPGSGGPTGSTATLLSDGRVLIVGGNPGEMYDTTTDTFRSAGSLQSSGYRFGMFWHNATTLRDGTVLITGGNDDLTCGGLADAEIYHPASGMFSAAGNMTATREGHTSTLLRDGNVLLTGGGAGWCYTSTERSAELYDVATRSFVPTAMMTRSRSFHTATLLNDGAVLITGGLSLWPWNTIRTAELYVTPEVTTRRRAVRRR